jgi:hypothetical protein
MKQVQQHHGVHAAGRRHEHALVPAQKAAGPDGLANVLQELAHAVMLTHGAGRGKADRAICGQSRKFWNCTETGNSFARTAAITDCNSSRLLPVTRTCES